MLKKKVLKLLSYILMIVFLIIYMPFAFIKGFFKEMIIYFKLVKNAIDSEYK